MTVLAASLAMIVSNRPTEFAYDHFNLRIIVIIDPKRCLKAIISPRQRAQKTFHLAFTHTREPPHEVSEDVREWDYGKFNLCLRDR
jgi:hypothetical protein